MVDQDGYGRLKAVGRALGKLCGYGRRMRDRDSKSKAYRVSKPQPPRPKATLDDLRTHLADLIRFTDDIKTSKDLIRKNYTELGTYLIDGPPLDPLHDEDFFDEMKQTQNARQRIEEAEIGIRGLDENRAQILADVLEGKEKDELILTLLFTERLWTLKKALDAQTEAKTVEHEMAIEVEIRHARLQRAEELRLRGLRGFWFSPEPILEELEKLRSAIRFLQSTDTIYKFAVDRSLNSLIDLRATKDWVKTTKSVELLGLAEDYDESKRRLQGFEKELDDYRLTYAYEALLEKGLANGRTPESVGHEFYTNVKNMTMDILEAAEQLRIARDAALEQGADLLSNPVIMGQDPISEPFRSVVGDGEVDSCGSVALRWRKREAVQKQERI